MYSLVVALLRPFTLVFLGVLIWTVVLWRTGRLKGRGLLGLGALLGILTLISMPLVEYAALGSLEWAYPPRREMPPEVDTIVVLSGALSVYDDSGEHVELAPDSLLRCLHAAELYRRAGGCRMVLCGGKVDPTGPGPTLAGAMGDFLIELGVKRSDLLLEEKSTSTYENALGCSALLEQHDVRRIVLVTDATHMLRASRCFSKLGIEVVPAACNHHATRLKWSATGFLPSAGAAGGVTLVCHEWLGLAWYRLHGRI